MYKHTYKHAYKEKTTAIQYENELTSVSYGYTIRKIRQAGKSYNGGEDLP